MKYVTMTDLSVKPRTIFDMVQDGETAIVLRHNKPVAAIVPLEQVKEDLSGWSIVLGKGEEHALRDST